MPRTDQTSEAIQADGERLFLEQARASYRDLRQAAQNAPSGKIIHHADAFAFHKGRELLQTSLEGIVQEQNDLLEKKTNSGNAPADANGDTSAIDSIKR
jgi:hypothetical protein